MNENFSKGVLYISATPIGNLQDISFRAVEAFKIADIICCEDTRVTKILLNAFNISFKKLVAIHKYNESSQAETIIQELLEGKMVVLVSDAGTPNISDPGAILCNKARLAGIKISPLPGASAVSTLVSISGFSNKYLFYGFLPSTSSAKDKVFHDWKNIAYAIIFFEAPHRLQKSLQQMEEVLGGDTQLIFARELTKKFETIIYTTCKKLILLASKDTNYLRGEITIMLLPSLNITPKGLDDSQEKTLTILAKELPPRQAVKLTNLLVGGDKEMLYNFLIKNDATQQ